MCREPELGRIVHLSRANLDFERAAVFVGDDCMQRLVTVRLRASDVVVVIAGNGRPLLMNRRQRLIALRHAGHDHSQATHVAQLVKGQPLAAHLVDDAVNMLRAADDFGGDSGLSQDSAHALGGLLDEVLSFDPFLVEQARNALVRFRLEKAE